jgi:hypothetical protein
MLMELLDLCDCTGFEPTATLPRKNEIPKHKQKIYNETAG